MVSIDILLEYFDIFKKHGNLNHSETNEIDSILKKINNREIIDEFDTVLNVVDKININNILNDSNCSKDIIKVSKKGLDFLLCDIMYNIVKYNNYISSNDINEEKNKNLNVYLKDILDCIEAKKEDIDSKLLEDLSRYADLEKLKDFAIKLKTDKGLRRSLYDKIEDKNVLLSILLHSDLETVDNVINVFISENSNLNKVVSNIPSIFIKDLINSKCKYDDVLTNYNNFMNNYKLIKEEGLDFKKMLNQCIFFITDVNDNKKLIDKLDSREI